MLNPIFTKADADSHQGRFVLDERLAARTVDSNREFATGPELRLQAVYGDELWLKMESLGVGPNAFEGRRVLDLCCGTGFLSFHVLARTRPASLTLLDLSPDEVAMAERLLERCRPEGTTLRYLVDDVLENDLPDASFDILIGNSFIHHLHDVPAAARRFRGLLAPGGILLALHEPTPAAVPLELGSLKGVVRGWMLGRRRYVDEHRPQAWQEDAPPPSADVWLFDRQDLATIFRTAGFNEVRTATWHLLRPQVVARRAMHLDRRKPGLDEREIRLLDRAVHVDRMLARLLPASMFGSLALLGRA